MAIERGASLSSRCDSHASRQLVTLYALQEMTNPVRVGAGDELIDGQELHLRVFEPDRAPSENYWQYDG